MPGYYVHFASCNPKCLKNRSFICGVETPDILKKYYKLYGIEGTREKYNKLKQIDMPDFKKFEERLKQKEERGNNLGMHYGVSDSPNILLFWNSLSKIDKKNPFYIGYLWHLLTDLYMYSNLDIKNKLVKKNIEFELSTLHKDWDKTNSKIRDTYKEVKLPQEVIDLNVVSYIEGEDTNYINWNELKGLIDNLRKFNPLEEDIDDIIKVLVKKV